MKKRILAVILTAAILTALFAAGTFSSSAASSQYAQTTVEGGAILHCFDWSYNNIKANLKDIRDAGYTAVQTSPVQPPKDYNASWTDTSGQWWKLYQPIGISIANGRSWLGTKAQLQSLCTEAEKYGIKVIVDIVANHMACKQDTGSLSDRIHGSVESELKNNADYWHQGGFDQNSNNRYYQTQGYLLHMPDLNTGSAYVQQRYLDLLKECIDLGVDGFRFDAAMHIETDAESSYNGTDFSSSFWSTVVGGAKEYGENIFAYGEVFGDPWGTAAAYHKYIHTTDPTTGDKAIYYAYNGNASKLASASYNNNSAAKYNVLWAESHDTYLGESGTGGLASTKNVSDEVIIKTWAIVGSRSESTSLFLARPASTMGTASADTTWKSTAVAEINKFKNYFNGQSESLSSSGNVAYNERGTSGVVISKLDGAGDVSLTAKRMAAGTYEDQITGNTFTVSGGKITGTVGSTGVAVVYNVTGSDETTAPGTEAPQTQYPEGTLSKTYYLFGWINGANYACEDDYTNMGDYVFAAGSDGTLTTTFDQKSYVAVKLEDNADWFMTDDYPGDNAVSANLYSTGILTSPNKLPVPGNKEVTFTLKENADGSLTLSYAEVVEPTDPPTEAPETQPETIAVGTYLVGDADGDGDISVLDATAIQKHLASLMTYDKIEIRGKVIIEDDPLNVTDATVIQKYLANIQVSNTKTIGAVESYS
ncbi:MAG: hypothetical protein IJH32_04790 [Ruminococcus sp.]|nr:hypothetical protein [Ruminococcus sp.]